MAFIDAYFKLSILQFEDYTPIRDKMLSAHKKNPYVIWHVIISQIVENILSNKGSKFVVVSTLERMLKRFTRVLKDVSYCSDENLSLMIKNKAFKIER